MTSRYRYRCQKHGKANYKAQTNWKTHKQQWRKPGPPLPEQAQTDHRPHSSRGPSTAIDMTTAPTESDTLKHPPIKPSQFNTPARAPSTRDTSRTRNRSAEPHPANRPSVQHTRSPATAIHSSSDTADGDHGFVQWRQIVVIFAGPLHQFKRDLRPGRQIDGAQAQLKLVTIRMRVEIIAVYPRFVGFVGLQVAKVGDLPHKFPTV